MQLESKLASEVGVLSLELRIAPLKFLKLHLPALPGLHSTFPVALHARLPLLLIFAAIPFRTACPGALIVGTRASCFTASGYRYCVA